MNPKWLLFSIIALIIVGGGTSLAVYLSTHPHLPSPAEMAAENARTMTSGNEINALTSSEPKPPNEGEIVAVECKPGVKLLPGEFIVGRPGAFLKVAANGTLKQSTGEELIGLKGAVDPTHADSSLELKVECAEDTDEMEHAAQNAVASPLLYVSNLKADQFFATQKGVQVQTKISEEDQKFFETQIDPLCLNPKSEDGEMPKGTTKCIHPELFAITDLNHDGNKEYWFNERIDWDVGIGVIEEPKQRILSACPGCALGPED